MSWEGAGAVVMTAVAVPLAARHGVRPVVLTALASPVPYLGVVQRAAELRARLRR